jgi:hypothetical protein
MNNDYLMKLKMKLYIVIDHIEKPGKDHFEDYEFIFFEFY